MAKSKEQEIPEGYKQTEIGVIPEDWALVTYDEAFKFLRTASYSRDQLGLGTTIYIHYGDVHTKWNHFVDLNEDLPTIEDEKVNSYSLVEDGDLIVADASEDYEGVCKSVEVRNKNSMKAISGLHTFLLRDKGNNFTDGFKGYIHCNSLVKASMDKLATGLKVYGVSKSNLKLIKIPQPPLPEQNAIISVLSDTDRLITKQEKLIRKKKNIKQGAMQELLTGRRRLPGYVGKWVSINMSESSILKARIGWQGLTTAEYLDSGDYYLVTGTDFLNGRINWKSCCFVDRDRYAQDKNIQLRQDDLLITKDGTIGKVGFIDVLPGPATLNSGVFVIRPKNEAYKSSFLYYVLMSTIFDNFLAKLQAGSTISHLYQKDFVNFTFMAPTIEEQSAIANVLSDMDAEIEKLESQLEKYRNIKQGMMQNLLTGKIRLIKK